MLKKQAWRAVFSSLKKVVIKLEIDYLFFLLFCVPQGKTHASRISRLIVHTFIWLLNPTNFFFFPLDLPALSVCHATPKTVSVVLSRLSRVQQKPSAALCVCEQPLTAGLKQNIIKAQFVT